MADGRRGKDSARLISIVQHPSSIVRRPVRRGLVRVRRVKRRVTEVYIPDNLAWIRARIGRTSSETLEGLSPEAALHAGRNFRLGVFNGIMFSLVDTLIAPTFVLALFVTVFHGWDLLFERVANLRIYINLAGYLFIATVVFVLWAVATFVFDHRTYMIITPGQIKVCEHIGDAVRTYDTVGLTFEKQRADLFRHYILGFGSGDLVVRTSGADRHEIVLPNVLGIGWKMKPIEDMLRERAMVRD